jgi:hypothetical protein
MLLAVVAMIIGVTAPAGAQGPDSERLGDRGWTCINAGPADRVHCFNPNAFEGSAYSALVFDPDGEEFLGVEALRVTEKDLSDRPCPPGDHTWEEVPTLVDTWACHHWKAGTEPDDD